MKPGRKKQKLLEKLYRDYQKAKSALISERDRLFPEGTLVEFKMLDRKGRIQNGSLYADQVLVDTMGHISPIYLEIVDENH